MRQFEWAFIENLGTYLKVRGYYVFSAPLPIELLLHFNGTKVTPELWPKENHKCLDISIKNNTLSKINACLELDHQHTLGSELSIRFDKFLMNQAQLFVEGKKSDWRTIVDLILNTTLNKCPSPNTRKKLENLAKKKDQGSSKKTMDSLLANMNHDEKLLWSEYSYWNFVFTCMQRNKKFLRQVWTQVIGKKNIWGATGCLLVYWGLHS